MRPSDASHDLQQVYWVGSFVILLAAVASLGWLFWRMTGVNKTHILRAFTCLLLGDTLFTLAYFPYHAHNAVASLVDRGSVDVATTQNSDTCLAVSALLVLSFTLMLAGVSLAAIQPFLVIRAGRRFNSAKLLSTPTVFVYTVVWVGCGAGAVVMAHDADLLGPYRGLYCGFVTFHGWQSGGYVVASASVHIVCSCAGFYLAHRQVQADRDPSGQAQTRTHLRVSKLVKSLGFKIAGVFAVLFVPISISALLGLAGVEVPAWFDVLGAWCAKLKTVADVWVILSLPVFNRRTPAPRAAPPPPRPASQSQGAPLRPGQGGATDSTRLVVWANKKGEQPSGQQGEPSQSAQQSSVERAECAPGVTPSQESELLDDDELLVVGGPIRSQPHGFEQGGEDSNCNHGDPEGNVP